MNVQVHDVVYRTRAVAPGSCIGILGDGQLGRMLALAAAARGYHAAVLGPGGRKSPAGQVSSWAQAWESGAHVSDELLDAFCKIASVVLVEWENVPVALVRRIEARGVRVCCSSTVLEIAQDRIKEKTLARKLGIPTPKFCAITSVADIEAAHVWAQESCVLKTCRDGYDGRGQIRLQAGESIREAWEQLREVPCILESMIDLAYELSVIVARSPHGMVCTGPFINTHENGILRTTQYPGSIPKGVIDHSCTAAKMLARELDVHGLLAIEFFAQRQEHGRAVRLLFNEMAPRPHNSGHLTIECCATSQFEQHVLAACNLPLGSVQFHSRGEMTNILGDEVNRWHEHFNTPEKKVHLYGKGEALPGRKMGHITRRWNTSDKRTV